MVGCRNAFILVTFSSIVPRLISSCPRWIKRHPFWFCLLRGPRLAFDHSDHEPAWWPALKARRLCSVSGICNKKHFFACTVSRLSVFVVLCEAITPSGKKDIYYETID